MPKKTAPLDLGLTRLPVILPICPRGTSDHVWGETTLESLGWCITRQHGVRHHHITIILFIIMIIIIILARLDEGGID